MTIVAGAVVGVLGVTGWKGFVFYLLSQALCAAPIVALAAASAAEQAARRRRRQARGTLPPPPLAPSAAPLAALVVPRCFHAWSQVLTEHVFGQTAVLSYLLCWMVFYNLSHVF
jgi:MFS family permease